MRYSPKALSFRYSDECRNTNPATAIISAKNSTPSASNVKNCAEVESKPEIATLQSCATCTAKNSAAATLTCPFERATSAASAGTQLTIKYIIISINP